MKTQCLRDVFVSAIDASFDHSLFAEAVLEVVASKINYNAIAEQLIANLDFAEMVSDYIESEYYDLPY